jgi:hypothetical protein
LGVGAPPDRTVVRQPAQKRGNLAIRWALYDEIPALFCAPMLRLQTALASTLICPRSPVRPVQARVDLDGRKALQYGAR